MIAEVSKKITTSMIENCIIDENEKEVYAYGMELMISTLISTTIILGLGIVLNRFWNTLFLVLPFYCIRIYAGGIHAETYIKCNLSFTVGFLFTLLGTEYIINNKYCKYLIFASLISAVVICLISPIEDHSRLLNQEERNKYNKKARISTIIWIILILILYLTEYSTGIPYMASGINAVLVVLLAGIIKNRLIGYKPLHV